MSTDAFDDLLAPHLEGMRRFVRRRMRTQDYAEDAVQQTLLLAFAHRNQLRNPAKFRSWLYSIAVNEIRLIGRSTKRCVSLSVNPELQPAGTETSPLIRFQEWERQTHLKLAMARLHEGDQTTLQLELDGLSIPETAAATAKSVSAAKSFSRSATAGGSPAQAKLRSGCCRELALMIVLSVSPFQSDHQFLEAGAATCNCQLARAVDLAGALNVLNQYEVSVIVYEHDSMPGSWRDMLQCLRGQANPAALIVTSRFADERLWAEALNLGAWDVLAKPFDRSEVTRSIEGAHQHWGSGSSGRSRLA